MPHHHLPSTYNRETSLDKQLGAANRAINEIAAVHTSQLFSSLPHFRHCQFKEQPCWTSLQMDFDSNCKKSLLNFEHFITAVPHFCWWYQIPSTFLRNWVRKTPSRRNNQTILTDVRKEILLLPPERHWRIEDKQTAHSDSKNKTPGVYPKFQGIDNGTLFVTSLKIHFTSMQHFLEALNRPRWRNVLTMVDFLTDSNNKASIRKKSLMTSVYKKVQSGICWISQLLLVPQKPCFSFLKHSLCSSNIYNN